VKTLLTSGGLANPSIASALERLLDKPIAQCSALLIPTGQWGATNTMAYAERWASDLGGPAYVIDDQTAITVADVVPEGEWRELAP